MSNLWIFFETHLVDDCVRSTVCRLNFTKYLGRELTLKHEQELAVKELLVGKHGKSLLTDLHVEMSRRHNAEFNGAFRNSVLIITPLRSIIMARWSK